MPVDKTNFKPSSMLDAFEIRSSYISDILMVNSMTLYYSQYITTKLYACSRYYDLKRYKSTLNMCQLQRKKIANVAIFLRIKKKNYTTSTLELKDSNHQFP